MRKFSLSYKIIILILVVGGVTVGMNSCGHMPDNINALPAVCFQSQVLPIFQNSCAMSGCHNGYGESGYDFTTYPGIMNAIVPGNADKSPAYRAITSLWGESAMPPKEPLSEQNRILIRVWIEQGAQNAECSSAPGSGNTNPTDPNYYNARACFQRDILPLIQTNCAIPGCHDGTSQEDDAAILTSYSSILKIVSPGNPGSSSLYRSISGSGEDLMPPPPQTRLSTAQIDSIYNWISYGALNENCGSMCDTAAAITYSAVVWPIIQTYCFGCHSGPNAQKGQHLENYQDVSAIAANGKLMGAIKSLPGYTPMPPAGSLSTCEITELEKWVTDGFTNNRLQQ